MLRPWKIEIQLDKKSGKAVYLQIADAIVSDIQSGRLKPGDALPGSRNLAEIIGVNRNTIVEALQVLLIEGWLISKERKGTFVSDTLPLTSRSNKQRSKDTDQLIIDKRVLIAIDDGHPDSSFAPVAELARAYRQLFGRKAKWQMMGYNDERGDPEFRQAIVRMLNHNRGMHVDEGGVCITRGSQMAMYLIAQCLFEKGDLVIIENPGYKPAWEVFERAGAELLPATVDDDGIVVEEVERYLKTKERIKAIYLTPHRQYPTTAILSLQRRLELISLSNQYGFTIIEDDYDNEFHFGYRPVLPMSSFFELENYVYIGTMSKVVAPALRIGFLASGNHVLVSQTAALRKLIDVQGDTIMEQAVLELIRDGAIKRHIRKASAYYEAKRDCAATLVEKHLKGKVKYQLPDGGLAFWLTPLQETDWTELSGQLEAKGIHLIHPEKYSYGKPVNGLRLGYGSLSEVQMEEVIRALSILL